MEGGSAEQNIFCQILLEGGLVLKRILYSGSPDYDESIKDGCGTLRISPSQDSYFEMDVVVTRSLTQNGIYFFLIFVSEIP